MVAQNFNVIIANEGQSTDPSTGEQELAIARRFSRDATVNVEMDNVMSKFKWGDAINGNSTQLLLTVQGVEAALSIHIEDKLILGRETEASGNIEVLDLTPFGGSEKGVSRTHAALQRLKGNLFLVDLGSTNKTYLNGQRLVSHELHILMKGDEIRLGNLVITINHAPANAGAK